MRNRDFVLVHSLYPAFGAMGRTCSLVAVRSRHPAHAGRGASQAGFGVDQELAGHDHFLPLFQSFADLRLAIDFGPDFNIDRDKFAFAKRCHHDAAGAGLNHGFGWHQQDIRARCRVKVECGKHARHQLAGWIGQFDPCFQRACGCIHFGQDRTDFALEYGAGQGWRGYFDRIARAHLCGKVFRHGGIDPDGAQPIDTE